MSEIVYPHTPTVDQVDDYHGTRVADPYRWLEETHSEEVKAWIEAQNTLTFEFLGRVPARENIRRRLSELWNYPKAWTPVRRGGQYFQLRNSGLQNQDVLYVTNSLDEEGRVLLDPNTLSDDGTIALVNWAVSPDGQWLAYATSEGGSDWMTWRVRNVVDGRDLLDVVAWAKFTGAAWAPDGSGFFYGRYEAPPPDKEYSVITNCQQLCFHRLGDPQSQDELVYQRLDQKEWWYDVEVTEDGRYLIMTVGRGSDVRNQLFYQDLQAEGQIVELIAELEAAYQFVGNDGTEFYLRTDFDAPRGRLIAVDTRKPHKSHWRTIIGEDADTLESVIMVHDELVALYLHDAHHRLKRFDRDGSAIGDIPLPTMGSLPAKGNYRNLSGQSKGEELFYAFSSFLTPETIYRYDFGRDRSDPVFEPPLDFDAAYYITRLAFATSDDGTRVPIFLSHRRDLKHDGQNPTLLYGYGGFNVPLVARFSVAMLQWLEMDGVLAWAILRGGGEYGQEWHEAGMLHNKQNVFNDFISCAEYLINEGITSPSRLAIMGGSNGGLLVGACLTQRPELFAAAIPVVGVLDMLRFHKFTIGWAWTSEYGSPEEPGQFETLLSYSPLHNLQPGTCYPACLIATGDHDDRVFPGHSFKFAAALQAAQAGEAPCLIRVQTMAGHGLGKPTAILIEEAADMWTFLAATLAMHSPL